MAVAERKLGQIHARILLSSVSKKKRGKKNMIVYIFYFLFLKMVYAVSYFLCNIGVSIEGLLSWNTSSVWGSCNHALRKEQ